MGMQGEMSLLGQVDCSSECCLQMSTLHPPGVSVFGCVVFADGVRNDRLCSMGM